MKQDNACSRVGIAIKNDLLSRGINTKEAAKRLGISPGGVSVYFSGRPFSAKAAQKWAKMLELDEKFLMSGIGSPSKYVTMALSPEEKDFILWKRKTGRKLSPKNYNNILFEESLSNITDAVDQLRSLVATKAAAK